MSNPLDFKNTIAAVQSGYTWSDILRAWVKFLPRTGPDFFPRTGNFGYDVEVTLTPRAHPLFQSQHHAIPFDTPSLDRVVLTSDLGALLAGTEAKVVLDENGRVIPDAVFQRRAVGL